MSPTLKSSCRYCQKIARQRARNFYYGFFLLPKARREAFCAVYAFMRYCDDVADSYASPLEKAQRLQQWREALERTLQGEYAENPILPAFHHAVRQYAIPPEYFFELIAGAEMDLTVRCYPTFQDLYQYCYRVASVVGLCSLHMFGFRDPAAKKLAEECGIAFQLTNILRDLREDAREGRVYLPLEDLERFRYSARELAAGLCNQQFLDLMHFEIERARSFYQRAYPLIEMVEPESRPALWTLISIYRGILKTIERNPESVFSRRAGLSAVEKIGVVLRATSLELRRKAGWEPRWQRLHA
ncbi:MAG: phytoene/squalene synthase family protein [Acidobacteria bacterium]|nr:phytoene/squalene synthase family protein [Acidobacteriota bacterium]